MRVTKLNGCGAPVVGDESVAVTDGYISVALSAQINEPEEIEVKNANGQTCVRDAGCAEFKGYTVEIAFCNVDPCLFSMLTGQEAVVDAAGEPIGFRMNSKKKSCDSAFALELWSGVPGVACGGLSADSGSFGYLLLPFVRAGVIGDFTIENAAVTFTVSGAVTLDGNTWGKGHYDVFEGVGAAAKLHEDVDPNDHLLVAFTTKAPPAVTDGCVAYPFVAPVAQAVTTPAPVTK
jgi:hypothetical protein